METCARENCCCHKKEYNSCDGCNVQKNPIMFICQAGVAFVALALAVSLLIL